MLTYLADDIVSAAYHTHPESMCLPYLPSLPAFSRPADGDTTKNRTRLIRGVTLPSSAFVTRRRAPSGKPDNFLSRGWLALQPSVSHASHQALNIQVFCSD